jgi:hypothetical protein
MVGLQLGGSMTTRLDTLLHETGILSRRSSRLEQSGRETPTAAAAEATGEAEMAAAAEERVEAETAAAAVEREDEMRWAIVEEWRREEEREAREVAAGRAEEERAAAADRRGGAG